LKDLNTKEIVLLSIAGICILYNFNQLGIDYGIGSTIGALIAGFCGFNFTKNRPQTAGATGFAFGFVGLLILLIANRISPPKK